MILLMAFGFFVCSMAAASSSWNFEVPFGWIEAGPFLASSKVVETGPNACIVGSCVSKRPFLGDAVRRGGDLVDVEI